MTIRVNNITLDIEVDNEIEHIYKKVAKKLNIGTQDIKDLRIVKESLDARKKNAIKFNYCVDVDCTGEKQILNEVNDKDVKLEEALDDEDIVCGDRTLEHRPIVVGMGPAGMFAGLLLARKGYKPLIIERGEKVEDRTVSVQKFWETGKLNVNSNVQFGEGGAGTFSDGKLTTRIKDRRCDFILRELVKSGAPGEIIYKGKPHIGTDILKNVVKNIREEIISLGGEIKFSACLEAIVQKDGAVKSIIVNKEEIPCEALILAIGHSSRDTYTMLYEGGILMESKPFAIGVRVEHLQSMMDENQYGNYSTHTKLRASEYRLTYQSKDLSRAAYSFCMCPGGEVVAAASEEGRLVTNGMSYYSRNLKNSNSAVVVTVGAEDFDGNSPLSGMEFQRKYEALAYKVGGGNYQAPVQLIKDFLNDKISTKFGDVEPTYRPGTQFRDMRDCLPKPVTDTLKESFLDFERKIKGFATSNGIMTGIETRTSAPVKIIRNENLESITLKGLYPAGEGAGFAGGIVSASVDGMKVAEKIIGIYKSKE